MQRKLPQIKCPYGVSICDDSKVKCRTPRTRDPGEESREPCSKFGQRPEMSDCACFLTRRKRFRGRDCGCRRDCCGPQYCGYGCHGRILSTLLVAVVVAVVVARNLGSTYCRDEPRPAELTLNAVVMYEGSGHGLQGPEVGKASWPYVVVSWSRLSSKP
jgi:hypothetical protein